MTAAEVRGTTLAYHQIQDLMIQPLVPDTITRFKCFLRWAEVECEAVTETSAPARWAKLQVGPVLAAAVGASVWMREKVASPNAAHRIFGLVGDRALTSHAAWLIVQPYIWEPVLSEQALASIRRQSGLRLKLPEDPTTIDVLMELTRPRGSAFAMQVGYWLADYIQTHREDATDLGEYYRTALADLSAVNDKGEMANIVTAHGMAPNLNRADWEALLHGRIPKVRLEARAGHAAARQFIVEYWEHWQAKGHKINPSLLSESLDING